MGLEYIHAGFDEKQLGVLLAACRSDRKIPSVVTLYYGNVIQTLRGEAEAETDGRSGLKSLELLVAMYRSAKDGVKVSLPLEC